LSGRIGARMAGSFTALQTVLYVTHFMFGIMINLRVVKRLGAWGGTCDDANSSEFWALRHFVR
jgi:hypothetical protein